jgi:RNA polymerase sigma-70 factor, ECF subfamily
MATCTSFATPPTPLLPLVAAGDHGAMRQLVRQFTPLVRSIARRIGAGDAAPEDLVQETMVRLWRSADRFDPARGSETTFVASVARNAAIDLTRRQAARPSVPVADPGDVAPAPSGAAEPVANPVAEQVTVRVTVRNALAKLPAAQRELIRLAYFEQLTQPEIAERLGIPLGTVKSRTFQAMGTLRAFLQETASGSASN